MPVALTTIPDPPPPPFPPRKRWTRAECDLLVSNGIWSRQRLELIDGELISKMGQNRWHVSAVAQMTIWLMDAFGRDRVNTDAPIDVAPGDNPINEPEPDLIVLTRPSSTFRSGNPHPHELLLVVEVSDTSLDFDLTVKASLYARADILEYWVMDVAGGRLIVHRDPGSSGYGSVIAYGEGESVAPLALNDPATA
jgi:Uma2 family endonuclease